MFYHRRSYCGYWLLFIIAMTIAFILGKKSQDSSLFSLSGSSERVNSTSKERDEKAKSTNDTPNLSHEL